MGIKRKENVMKNVKEHLGLLGLKAEDKVTGLKGIVTCVSFDLYGCIQAILKPPAGKDGKHSDGSWMDIRRLKIIDKKPVMDLPDYDTGYVSEGKKGAAEKPLR